MKFLEKYGRALLVITLIVASAYIRTQKYLPNVSPITAMALFGGATLASPWSFAVPLFAQLASDVFIGFDALPITYAIYGSFVLTVLLGMWLKHKRSPWRIILASLGSSTIFYLITNAAVWKFSKLYPPTFDGLVLSYVYAIPFFRNTLFGDMAYVFSFFLVLEFAPVLVKAVHRLAKQASVGFRMSS